MISKIAFYIINNKSSLKEKNLYTCRIIEKAYNNNHKVYIHTANIEETQNFDTQLWTFNDISFIPHEIYNEETNSDSQILIGYNNPPEHLKDILFNLTTEVLPFYERFDYLIEVIPNDEILKALARKRFKIYQNNGHQVEIFKV